MPPSIMKEGAATIQEQVEPDSFSNEKDCFFHSRKFFSSFEKDFFLHKIKEKERKQSLAIDSAENRIDTAIAHTHKYTFTHTHTHEPRVA